MSYDLSETIAILQQTPRVLRTLLGDLSDHWTQGNEGPKTWSAFDVVGHLIGGEEIDWIPRARIILARGGAGRFDPVDRFRNLEANRGRSMPDLLDEFSMLRDVNLKTLEDFELTEEDLALTGEHPEFGQVTLSQLLSTWAVHDLSHISQATRVMARQYSQEVGPWSAYLPILGTSEVSK